MLRQASWIPLSLGGAIGTSFYAQTRSKVLNDVVVVPAQVAKTTQPAFYEKTWTGRGFARFNGKLDYHQLAYGSFTGMLTGYFVGKIGRWLVSLFIGGVLTSEYLQYKHLIDVRPLTDKVFSWTAGKLQSGLSLEDPSFKGGFAAAFLIAAFNS